MSAKSSPDQRRRRPVQARSRVTVEHVLEAAARVFRREGFAATTNRIAVAAGVSIGSLYEYFPNKEALLFALAERHVETAETEIRAALLRDSSTRELLSELQQAIIESQRFPSQALELIAAGTSEGLALRKRASELRDTVLRALAARATHLAEPELRARAAFGAVAELTARTMYEIEDEASHAALSRHLLDMAASCLE